MLLSFPYSRNDFIWSINKDEETETITQIKIKRRISNRRLEKLKSNLVKNNQFSLERVTSLEFDQHVQLNAVPKKTTAEITLGFIISNWDIILMTSLYFAGAYEIDIYHIALMIFFVWFLLYPKFWRRNYIFLILFVHFIVLIKYLYTLTYEWLDDISKSYLEVLGFSTLVIEQNKFFKSNLINNNWLIVLLSYIQYRTYKSDYFQKKLSAEAIQDDKKEFARKHPKWTRFFNAWQDFIYVSIPWLSFIAYITNAFLNTKTVINFIIYAYSLWLIAMYIISHKDTSKSLLRLIFAWNIGIAMTIAMFLIILVYQVLWLAPVANSNLIKDVVSILPTFFVMNAELLGFKNFNGSTQIELSIILLAYVLNFVFAIITKRHLLNLYNQIIELEKQELCRQELNRIRTHKYIFWLMKLKFIWPVFDFFAKFMFQILSLIILVFSIHWKLSVINWVYLVALSTYYISVPFSLLFKSQEQTFEAYANINGKVLDVEEVLILKRYEDSVAGFRILSQRKVFSAVLFIITTIALLLTYLTIPIDDLKVKYANWEGIWNFIIISSFIIGVNSTKNSGNYSFGYQCLGYLIILILLVIEQKWQLWLKDKFHILEFIEQEKKYKVPETVKQAMFETIKEEASDIEESFVKIGDDKSKEELRVSEESKYSLNFEDEIESCNSK